MADAHRFTQVDVFGSGPLSGNPVAVVHDADGLDDDQMQAFARWTNLSETTFLLAPTTDDADYRLRIFTPGRELPFAGHPTLGSAHAWVEAGGAPSNAGRIVQECGVGLVAIEPGQQLAFAAPPLIRSGPVALEELEEILDVIGLDPADVVESAWIDNGAGWLGLLARDADVVLALQPDFAHLRHEVGVVGPRADGDTACEVRAFCSVGMGITEDPVTGSLHASIGQWLAGTHLPTSYVAAQGTAIGRSGRVHVRLEGSTVWVGGNTVTTLHGHAEF